MTITYPHRIRLRDPWERQAQAGRVRFRRRFGYPGRIDAEERVWLTFAGIAGVAAVELNGTELGRHEGIDPFEFEATALLRPRNEVIVDVEGIDEPGVSWGEVALEVRRTAFLRGVRVERIGAGNTFDLHTTGQVVGVSERPLDLYVVLDRSTVGYATITPSPAGEPFHLVAEKLTRLSVPGPIVKIDLVDGAVIWYTFEEELKASSGNEFRDAGRR
jgi:hypothetical protein